MIRPVIVGLALAYLGALVFLYVMQRQMIFLGQAALVPGAPSSYGLGRLEEVRIPTPDGLTLRAWFAPPEVEGRPVVVHFHGNASSLAGRAEAVRPQLAAGYGVLVVGYRGYSGNPGQPTELGLYTDARAQLNWLRQQTDVPIVLQGESLGTGVAMQMAIEFPVAAVILESPYTALPDVAAARYPIFPVRLLMKDRFENLRKIGRLKAPLFMISGEKDRTVPPVQGRALYEAAPGPKRFLSLSGADHNSLYQHGASAAIMTWLAELYP